MLEYQGQPCMICGKPFTEQDDIVTCPDCGTPYHRACYRETGACVNTALHESGGSWVVERRQEIVRQQRAEKFAEQAAQAAERERGEQPKMFNGSLYDGVRLNPHDPCVGLDPEENMDGATMREVAEFVGTNRFYYLPLFRLMKQTGRKYSFNLVCLFFPQLYFANRKMWLMTLGSMIAELLLSVTTVLQYMNEMQISPSWVDVNSAGFLQIDTIMSFVRLGISVIWCLFGNYFYYRFAVRRIKTIKKEAVSEAARLEQIQSEGGTSTGNIVLALVIEASLVAAFVFITTLLH